MRRKALVGIMVVCLIMLGVIAVNSVVAKGSELSTLFEDDFSTDKGWTSSPASDIVRDSAEKNVHWRTDRSYVQSMYHSIDPLTGDFKLHVDAMITDTTNNCWIAIGLTDDVKEVSGSWEGLALKIGWFGGGTPYHYWYAYVGGKYDDGTTFTSTTGHVTPYESTWDGFVSISPNKWYSYELTKTGSNWKLMVYDEDEKLVGSLSGELTGSFSPFKYVYFGNGDTHDWPSANGKIDNFQLLH